MFKTALVMLVAMMFSICSPVDAAASVGGIADVLSVLLLWFISPCHCCSSCCFHNQLEFQFFFLPRFFGTKAEWDISKNQKHED